MIDANDIEQFKIKLEGQRSELRQTLRRTESEAQSLDVDSALDSADVCAANMSKESLFERSSQRRAVLHLIEAALRRIRDGSFGICITCGEDIPARRLGAVPWTQFCLHCPGGNRRGSWHELVGTPLHNAILGLEASRIAERHLHSGGVS